MNAPSSSTAPSPSPPDDRARWGAGVALLALVATLGATIFVAIPGVVIGDDSTTREVLSNVVSSVLQNAVFVGVPLLIVVLAAGKGLRRGDFGLRLPARPWRIVAGLVVAYVAYVLLSGGLAQLIGVGDQQDDLPEKLGAKESAAAGIVIAFCVTVLAPIGEEFLLRGVVFPGLRDGLRKVAPAGVAIAIAAVADGAMFGALHAGGSQAIFLPILALFGAVLCLLYQWTGSLYAPILLHATNNTVAIATALDWTFAQGVILWVCAVAILALIALAVRGIDARLPTPRRCQAAPRAAD
ncbi:CPBP family intramembrane glutamic endopeptidase [Patulibacter sp. S7RM1-6]